MPVSLDTLVDNIDPAHTVLLFGAGSSIPSGAPSVDKLIEHYASKFKLPSEGFSLSEITMLAQTNTSRRRVIEELRPFFDHLKPSGGIGNLPLFQWKGIYTTNYDTIVEQSYENRRKSCRVYSSNFDFGIRGLNADVDLFKLHGTIDNDVSDGNQSRIILTEEDYELTEEYRDYLYDRLKGDLAGSDLIIIGQSLADPDLSKVVNRAIALNAQVLSPARLTLLLYEEDPHRASLYERRGLTVIYGGIDEFFSSLSGKQIAVRQQTPDAVDDIVTDKSLISSLIEVASISNAGDADVSAMFNGWPASHADIQAGLTFERNLAKEIGAHFEDDGTLTAIVLGAAGVGKSTAARQSIQTLRRAGFRCWEHKSDETLNVKGWRGVATNLKEHGLVGALLIDEAHAHLHELNDLVDQLVLDDNAHLKLVIISTKHLWYPRNKTANIYKYGKEFRLSQLAPAEIDRLLNLIERQPSVRQLVENAFSGFSRQERRRRLVTRCEADMFVCLKNIFTSEAFDDIILREYAGLDELEQNVYRHVAAMETAGVRVHRQLVIRLLEIPAKNVETILKKLDDIVEEYSVDGKLGIYGWKCRHQVISGIIAEYKYSDTTQKIELYDRVIDSISPTYDIEIRTIRELCNLDGGISKIADRNEQNRLLRKMISSAPAERVPRHRLIRNLIDQGSFEKADTEIRVFSSDFGTDGPVHRYKIRLMIARAINTPGIMDEDRIAILEKANDLAVVGVQRYPNNKYILATYADLGIEYYRKTGSYEFFDAAVSELRKAEDRLGDPDITTMITRYERRIAGQPFDAEVEFEAD